MLRRLAPLLCGMLGVPSIAACSAPSDSSEAMALLRHVAGHYREARTIWLEGSIEARIEGPAGNQATEARFRVALAPGGRIHDEIDHPQIGQLRIADGDSTWTALGALSQFTASAKRSSPDAAIDLADIAGSGGMAAVLLGTLQALDQGVEKLKRLPDEDLELGGSRRHCRVMEIQHTPPQGSQALQPPRRFWIDPERRVVLQQATTIETKTPQGTAMLQKETLRFRKVALGGAIPDTVFAFHPAPSSRRVERFQQPGVVDLTGTEAVDFTLPDLAGARHRLKDERGKVVLLDFWATWCGPCRVQMPMVDKLHQEFHDKGLVVYAVNQGESAERARAYLAKNRYSTTTLLDQKAEVGRTYKVSGIPTLVIIDREGKIAAHFVGVRSEAVLRDALKRAGVR